MLDEVSMCCHRDFLRLSQDSCNATRFLLVWPVLGAVTACWKDVRACERNASFWQRVVSSRFHGFFLFDSLCYHNPQDRCQCGGLCKFEWCVCLTSLQETQRLLIVLAVGSQNQGAAVPRYPPAHPANEKSSGF